MSNSNIGGYLKVCNNRYFDYLTREIRIYNAYNSLIEGITHKGNFHADDIFSIVLLSMYKKCVKRDDTPLNICRVSYNEAELFKNTNAVMFDIGNGELDHHQKDGNGAHFLGCTKKPIPKASFGLMWEKYGKEISRYLAKNLLDDETSDTYINYYVYRNLVLAIDAIDNGIFPYSQIDYSPYKVNTISLVISQLNPPKDVKLKDSENYGLGLALNLAMVTFEKIMCDIKNNNALHDYHPYHDKACVEFTDLLSKHLLNMGINTPHTFSQDDLLFITEYKKNDNKDIWLKRFDFSRIWKDYGLEYCMWLTNLDKEKSVYIYNSMYTQFLMGIDADLQYIGAQEHRVYGSFNTYSIVDAFSRYEYGLAEAKLVHKDLLCSIIDMLIKNVFTTSIFRVESKQYIEEKLDDALRKYPKTHILILDKKAVFSEWIHKNPKADQILFVILPDDDRYKVVPVSDSTSVSGFRMGFPVSWYGYNIQDNFQYNPGIEGCSFVHDSGFMAICDSLKNAKRLCLKAIAVQTKKR